MLHYGAHHTISRSMKKRRVSKIMSHLTSTDEWRGTVCAARKAHRVNPPAADAPSITHPRRREWRELRKKTGGIRRGGWTDEVQTRGGHGGKTKTGRRAKARERKPETQEGTERTKRTVKGEIWCDRFTSGMLLRLTIFFIHQVVLLLFSCGNLTWPCVKREEERRLPRHLFSERFTLWMKKMKRGETPNVQR